MKHKRIVAFAMLAAGALLLGGCTSAGGEATTPAETTGPETAAPGDTELAALVEAAQEEGSVTLYGIIEESALRTVGEAFTEKYGVNVTVLRLVSADLSQRFAAEADAGAVQADAILLTYSPFFDDALGNGWLTDVASAGIPGYPADFPAEYVESDGTPIIQMAPTELVYNTDAVDSPPTSWEVYADPAYKGKILMTEPASSPANLSFWSLMIDTYGEDFLRGIAENEPTWMNSAVNTTQGVAAGEGDLAHPGVAAIVKTLQAQNAPIASVALGPTTGPEVGLGVSADAPHPNAARLLAHYLISEEGNTLLAEISGASSPYGVNAVDGYERPGPIPEDRRGLINELLGLG